MEDIRISKIKEKNILEIRFKFPLLFFILLLLTPVIPWGILMIIALSFNGVPGYVSAPIMLVAFMFIPIVVSEYLNTNRLSNCLVTNKAIKIYKKHVFSEKNCCFRLDQINDVELNSVLGIKQIILSVSQGNLSNKKIVLNFVRDGFDAYNSLVSLLTTQENNTDSFCKLFGNDVEPK